MILSNAAHPPCARSSSWPLWPEISQRISRGQGCGSVQSSPPRKRSGRCAPSSHKRIRPSLRGSRKTSPPDCQWSRGRGASASLPPRLDVGRVSFSLWSKTSLKHLSNSIAGTKASGSWRIRANRAACQAVSSQRIARRGTMTAGGRKYRASSSQRLSSTVVSTGGGPNAASCLRNASIKWGSCAWLTPA